MPVLTLTVTVQAWAWGCWWCKALSEKNWANWQVGSNHSHNINPYWTGFSCRESCLEGILRVSAELPHLCFLLFYSVNILNYINWFSNKPVFLGINSPWSWCIITFIYCCIQFINILSMFMYLCLREILAWSSIFL